MKYYTHTKTKARCKNPLVPSGFFGVDPFESKFGIPKKISITCKKESETALSYPFYPEILSYTYPLPGFQDSPTKEG